MENGNAERGAGNSNAGPSPGTSQQHAKNGTESATGGGGAVFEDVYELLEKLGSGGFATVKLARHRQTGEHVAVKIMHKSRVRSSMWSNELALLRKMKHPNLITMREHYESVKDVYIVMDLMTGGALFDRIVQKKKFSEKEAAHIIYQILSGLTFLHEQNIVHRDIKPENVLMETKDDDSPCRISDFGLATTFSDDVNLKSVCGSLEYMAPEIIEHKAYRKSVDMWSLGALIYVLLCGRPPFRGKTDSSLKAAIVKAEYTIPDHVSDHARALITGCLKKVPTERITAPELLLHPWVLGKEATDEPILGTVMDMFRQYQAERTLTLVSTVVLSAVRLKRLLKNRIGAASPGSAGPDSAVEESDGEDTASRASMLLKAAKDSPVTVSPERVNRADSISPSRLLGRDIRKTSISPTRTIAGSPKPIAGRRMMSMRESAATSPLTSAPKMTATPQGRPRAESALAMSPTKRAEQTVSPSPIPARPRAESAVLMPSSPSPSPTPDLSPSKRRVRPPLHAPKK